MCGITGFWNPSQPGPTEELASTVTRMASTLAHRGPDDSGVWIDVRSGLALGHRRLSILDLSPEGHQPMHSQNGRFTIIFNGEIYNFLDIRRDLESRGHFFRGHSDTEVMLAAFTEWGVEASVPRFNGMFAFAAWDGERRVLYLCRDRAGKKPLYYGRAGSTLLFASELKALARHPAFRGEIDRGALALYLRFGYVPSPYSIYRGISKLPAGCLLAIRNADPSGAPLAYWSVQETVERGLSDPFRGSEAEALEELDALVSDAVKIRMISDVPLGAFLSGGIDSSLVVAYMQSQNHGPAKTFSIGFAEEGYNEAPHAKAVAKHLGSDHTELYISPSEAMAVIPKLAAMYDEPFADSSQIPTYLVSKLARTEVTVALSGDGGDELFAGYAHYFHNERLYQRYRRAAAAPAWVRNIAASAVRRLAPDRYAGSVLTADLSSPADVHRALVSRWANPAELLPGVAEPETGFVNPRRHVRTAELVESMMYLDAAYYLPDDILVKVDRASMAVSLETRCPLLDYRMFEFAWRLPLAWKRCNTTGKLPLRKLLYRRVPRELVERPKQGFAVPVAEWARGPMRQWAEDLLSDHRLQRDGLLSPSPVRRMWTQHLGRARGQGQRLWTVLMFQAWLDMTRSTQKSAMPAPAPVIAG